MLDRFTDRARKTMSRSLAASLRFSHDFIGPEHMTLGLCDESTGVHSDMLRDLGMDLGKLRAAVEKKMTIGTAPAGMRQLPFTPQSKRVLEHALAEAVQLGHNYIGTEHLLLGVLREPDSLGAQALSEHQVRLDRARETCVQLLGPHHPVQPTRSDNAGSTVRDWFEQKVGERVSVTYFSEEGGAATVTVRGRVKGVTTDFVTLEHLIYADEDNPDVNSEINVSWLGIAVFHER